MEQVTYRLESELDFLRITSSLKESNIPFVSRKYSDSNFPFFEQSRAFGDISVALKDEAELRNRIKSLTNNEPLIVVQNNETKVRKSGGIWRIVTIVYAIVISLVCFKYWYINYRSGVDKNNTIEWSYDGQDFIMKNKKTGIISHRSTDANFDLNFEEVRSYSRNGVKVVEWRDKDEDGFYEEVLLFNLNEEPIGSEFDTDNDGVTDRMMIILDNKDTLKLLDTNKNGFLEIIK
jgi:hypothetical protein